MMCGFSEASRLDGHDAVAASAGALRREGVTYPAETYVAQEV